MNIVQMHSAVRKLTQQMGMQHVRVILPEDIDELLNMAISETINTELANKANESASRDLPSNIKIGQINALRTLYDVFELNLNLAYIDTPDADKSPVTIINYNYFTIRLKEDAKMPSARMYYAAAIKYYNSSDFKDWFPIRIIEDAYLGNTTSDYLIKPTYKSPVMTIKHGVDNIVFDLYFGKMQDKFTIPNTKYFPHSIRLSYIKNPAIVSIDGGVDCDLPEYMHERIVSLAAQLWINSVMFNKSTMREEAVKAAE